MGREAWIQALNKPNYDRWQKARNYAIYQAVKQGGRGAREQIAKAHNISRQRVAELVELTERRIENGDYDDQGFTVIKSVWQEGALKVKSRLESQLKDLD